MTIGGSDRGSALAALTPLPAPAAPIAAAERSGRLEHARAAIVALGADALLIGAGASLRYFTGIPWSQSERLVALLLPVAGEPQLVCPRFELGSLTAVLQVEAGIVAWEEDEDPIAMILDRLPAGATIALDPLLPFGAAARFAARRRVIDAAPAIDGLRAIKSPAELALLAQAKAMTLEVHRRAATILRPGIRASEVIRFIDDAHRALGAAGSSFCAVQFGEATAYPHGLPGDQRLADGDLVLIDTGCTVDGYHSDITRTYAFGEVTPDARRLWTVEREAQEAAFAAVRPGITCEAIDAAARAVLTDAGLGPDYRLPGLPHRTGHGIGLAIHEPPYLVRGDRTPLLPGMCFSDEPMIVVPGRFGIRLEDHFHVTSQGGAWFTPPQPSITVPVA